MNPMHTWSQWYHSHRTISISYFISNRGQIQQRYSVLELDMHCPRQLLIYILGRNLQQMHDIWLQIRPQFGYDCGPPKKTHYSLVVLYSWYSCSDDSLSISFEPRSCHQNQNHLRFTPRLHDHASTKYYITFIYMYMVSFAGTLC